MASSVVRVIRALLVPLAALVLAGCAANLEVSVQVLTDLVPQVDFDRVVLQRDGREVVGRVVSSGQRFDRPYVLAELRDVSPGSNVRLTVLLQRGGGRVIARTIETRIDASRVLLFVLSSSCQSVTCPPDDEPSATECSDGVCVAPRCEGAACSPDAGQVDLDDAFVAETDAGIAGDAPQPIDAPSIDAPPSDAGPSIDAPVIDARAADAFAADARDGGSTDARVPVDAWGTCTGRAAGFVCRASRGPCDLAETCDGLSAACPRDALAPSTTVCRGRARDAPCDAVETCTGRSTICPLDVDEADGTSCNEYCGDETCSAGRCIGGVSCNPLTHACCSDRCMPTPCRAADN